MSKNRSNVLYLIGLLMIIAGGFALIFTYPFTWQGAFALFALTFGGLITGSGGIEK